jgi:peptide/nickel transport system permease protein
MAPDPLGFLALMAAIAVQLAPVLAALAAIMVVSVATRRRTGLYGRIFDNPIGIVGLAVVLFWVLVALMAERIMTHDPLAQLADMKNVPPGAALADPGMLYPHYLLGGDVLGRCVFSRAVAGARDVLAIAPPASALAYLVGILLGLLAGYYGRWLDWGLSFVANAFLAFPVILLFYLLVSPEIRDTAIPAGAALVLFAFPTVLLVAAAQSRWLVAPARRNVALGVIGLLVAWVVAGVVFGADPLGVIRIDSNMLNVFVAVTFINAPTVFRIVRATTMDIKERDYVMAARTRGESAWFIMLWEILPNARGPLIVDFCLRIGYTTILLGALGFFGLGVSPESPDWGSTISEGRRLMAVFPHSVLVPAISLLSLVLGLNLLADALREESLRD